MIDPDQARDAEPTGYYNTSAHLIWIGDRTRQPDHAHIEYARGIENTIGIKVGPTTKAEDPDLLPKVLDSKFTHILLGPEQVSKKAFRVMLRKPEFQSKIGLVAIDECHLIMQWSSFRPDFTLFGELRTILHQDVAC